MSWIGSLVQALECYQRIPPMACPHCGAEHVFFSGPGVVPGSYSICTTCLGFSMITAFDSPVLGYSTCTALRMVKLTEEQLQLVYPGQRWLRLTVAEALNEALALMIDRRLGMRRMRQVWA